MTEFGIFSDEGLLEGGFYSRDEAQAALANYDPDDGQHVGMCCPDHPEEEKDTCESCNNDEE